MAKVNKSLFFEPMLDFIEEMENDNNNTKFLDI